MPPLSEQLSEKGKPWPEYFLVRTTGEVVPLIAVDELPRGTDLDGVPRSLDLEDTIGMLNLGLQRSSGAFYQIIKREEKNEISLDLPARTKVSEDSRHQARPTRAPNPSVVQAPTSHHPLTMPNPTSSAHPTNPPHGSNLRLSPARGLPETQICRHWCAHGICKWGQQCRYRHIMPMTLPGLREVGLSDWPSWYRALNPTYFASEMMSLNTISQRPGTARRLRARGCSGNGCCGVAGDHAHGGSSPMIRGSPGRLKGAGHDRLGKEDMGVGEQILERLRSMPRYRLSGSIKGAEEKKVSSNVLLEKAAIKGTRNWEEESDESEVEEKVEAEDKKTKGGKEKLVDV